MGNEETDCTHCGSCIFGIRLAHLFQGDPGPPRNDLQGSHGPLTTLGMPRADVKNYLDTRNIRYDRVRVGGEEADRFEIQIGTEPGGFGCEDWRVVVAMDFGKDDRLKDVRVTKWGTCL
jgi:hypothetical protein